MTIGRQLILAAAGTLALTVVLACSTFTSLNSIGRELDTSLGVTSRSLELAAEIGTAVAEMRSAQRGVEVFSMLRQPTSVAAAQQAFRAGVTRTQNVLTEAGPLLTLPASRADADTLEAGLNAWERIYQQVDKVCSERRFDRGFESRLNTLIAQTTTIQTNMVNAADDLVRNQKTLLADSKRNSERTASFSRGLDIVLTAISVLVGTGLLILIRRITGTVQRIAAGMAATAEQVASASAQVASTSQGLASGASEQAASLQETSASSGEIQSMTQKNASNSSTAAELMSDAAGKVDEANRVVEHMVESMHEINAASGQIVKIIRVIDEIAFQTNILALNAAVEAARAGEAGMGFAVVADEVRNLAQRCSQAAKDTAGLIDESVNRTNDGRTKLEQVTRAIQSIVESTSAVKTLVAQVKLDSQDQAQRVGQIAVAVNQIQQVTQNNAAGAEESAAASQELSSQAEAMHKLASQLQRMVGAAA